MNTLSTEQLLILLQEAFDSGFTAGFHCEENPANPNEYWEEYKKEWEKYKKENLSEYEE